MEGITTVVDNTVLDRLAKLIELQARPGNVHEAEAAAARIQSLLTKHQLTLLDAQAYVAGKPGNTAAFIKRDMTLDGYTYWREMLLSTLAKQNFCRSIRNYEETTVHKTNSTGWRLGSTFSLIGREDNIAAVIRLYDYLEATIDRLGKEYAAVISAKMGPIYREAGLRYNPKGEGIAFRNGAVVGVAAKLWQARQDEIDAAGSSALVVVEESKLDEAVESEFGELEPGKELALDHKSASFKHGIAAGFKINTAAQLADTGQSGTLPLTEGS